jgi:hypothetical protein
MTIDEAFKKGDVSGRVFELCYQVTRGAKPAASLDVARDMLPVIASVISGEGCKYRVTADQPARICVDLYQMDHVLVVLQTIPLLKGIVPDAFIQWCIGKVYGYSEVAIAEFLREQGMNPPPEAKHTAISWVEASLSS